MNSTAAPRETPASAPLVDVVIPVYNEEADLERSVHRLHAYLNLAFPFPARITIADNASTDGTWPIARRLAHELRGVQAVHLPEKGRGGALAAVWQESDAPVVAYMDVDLSTDLDALLPLVAPLISGHSDLAIGSRLAPGARVVRGPRRELISRAYNLLLKLTLRVRFRDAQCGFKAVRTDVARELLPQVEDRRWFFDTELLVLAERKGLRIHEVPVDWTDDPDTRVDLWSTAVDDLRGILRIAVRPPAAQLAAFAAVGAASTAAYVLLYWLMRPLVPIEAANATALVVTAIANTAANRRFTFGVQGRSGLALDHAGGLVALALALTTTNLAIAGMQAAYPDASPLTELLVLGAANAAATMARFVLLRALIVGRRRLRARVVEIPRRNA
ncbi:MAG TPA: dolichyl-phosphate beta-glucosyltransferase [Candidatus Dormibacteraeota bacterium]|nr:dolichyl-phosphate beta-glucosyltransferase [Candidatus Dormibacteraeota bacterium]